MAVDRRSQRPAPWLALGASRPRRLAWSIRPRLSPPVTKRVFTAVEGGSAKTQTFDRVRAEGVEISAAWTPTLAKRVAAPLSVSLDDAGVPGPDQRPPVSRRGGFGASLTRPVCKGGTEVEPGAEVGPKA
jgi:hypothetical protein